VGGLAGHKSTACSTEKEVSLIVVCGSFLGTMICSSSLLSQIKMGLFWNPVPQPLRRCLLISGCTSLWANSFPCVGEKGHCQCLFLALLTFVRSWKGTDESEDIWIGRPGEFTLAGVLGPWPCPDTPGTVALEKSLMQYVFWRLELRTMWLDRLPWERDQPVHWRRAGMGEAAGLSQVCV